MSETLRGSVDGAAGDLAVRLAGALAECGVRRLSLEIPGRPEQTLDARETDLPGMIRRGGPGMTLRCPEIGLRIEVSERRIAWSAPESPVACAFVESMRRGVTE